MSFQESGDQLGETGIIDKIKNALDSNRENLLIVAFVLIIIGGVWAYMQAPQKPDASSGVAGEITSENEGTGDNDNATAEATKTEDSAENTPAATVTSTEKTDGETVAVAADEPKTVTEPAVTATNDGQSISITAVKGDGLTHVARKALKEYLNGNNETLNSEQKIYIEDYLRKHSSYRSVNPSEVLSYKNDLVKEAIEKAKALTEYQLKNLEKYSKLVKNL